MRTKTMSEIGRFYIDKNSGSRSGRDYLLKETYKKSNGDSSVNTKKQRSKK